MASSSVSRSPAKAESASKLPFYVMGALVLVGLAVFAYLQFSPKQPPAEVPLSDDARAYVSNLKLSDVNMKATKNYFSQMLLEIEGNVQNAGNRNIDQIEIYCIFHDISGQVILKQRVPVVNAATGGLKSGETKSFRLPFDQIPDGWNQTLPQLVIASTKFS